ncbi:MAG: hypothetical protein HY662_02525, partial [Chloroflexi bacterium]|nr:hypothetical protein [Chloroflexota bacterium]
GSGDHTASTLLTLETANLAQLSRLFSKIEGMRGVINVSRIGDGASTKATPPADVARS